MIDEPLDAQPSCQRAQQRDAGIADKPLVVPGCPQYVELYRRLLIVHHASDLLTGPQLPSTAAISPAQEVILRT